MKKSYLKTTVRGVSALALLALSLWFGLLPYYRLAALLVAALILPVLLRPEWTFSIVLAALIGCGASLWAFRASGYHYASLLPFLVAALMLVFRFGKRGLKRLAGAATALALILLLAAEAPILHTALNAAKSDAPYVIVLGAAVYGEDPSLSLVHRSDRAMEHLETNPSAVAVLSGGQGEGEDISEAECMGRYLKSKGVNEGRMLLEDRSTSTLENLTFSKKAIEQAGGDPSRVAIVSSSYHLYRACRMASALGMEAEGLRSADGCPVYMTGMYLREALAVWKLWVSDIYMRPLGGIRFFFLPSP
ncbi:MAG: YdcF family protein [Clostridia bacterium]|nr:YdcF family protein [Clostridia bacterium]